jgi:hypothetical protein
MSSDRTEASDLKLDSWAVSYIGIFMDRYVSAEGSVSLRISEKRVVFRRR